eukprot:6174371-Pleurochrysis_carterae.AAC.1
MPATDDVADDTDASSKKCPGANGISTAMMSARVLAHVEWNRYLFASASKRVFTAAAYTTAAAWPMPSLRTH